MKKLIALLLVLVMVAGLVACAGSNDETKGNDTTNTENTADSNGDSNTDCFQWFKDTKMKANHNETIDLITFSLTVSNGSKILK